MIQPDDFGSEFLAFAARVEELRVSRTGPAADHSVLLDAALLELQHIVERMGPAYEELSARRTPASPGARSGLRVFKTIFERLPLPVALVDGDTVVRWVNEAATGLTGVPASYVAGRQLCGLLVAGDRVALRSQVAAVARGEGGRGLTVQLQQQPERPLDVWLSDLVLPKEPETAVLVLLGQTGGTAPPYKGPVPRESLSGLSGAVRQAGLTDLLDRTTATLLRRHPGGPAEALTAAAGLFCEQLADWAVLDLVPAVSLRRSAVLGLGTSCDPTLEKAVTQQDPHGCPVVVEAVTTGSPSLLVQPDELDCLGTDDSGASLCVRADVTSLLVLPLKVSPADGGRVLGVLTLLRTGARPSFSLTEARAGEMVARHMAIAMESSTG